MDMPERSFGRTVRYRRTKLGLSQAKLGELVGRSAATIKAWERDKSRPTDPKVLATLSAILGVSERQLFDKADVDRPLVEETSPTVEQALASLSREQPVVTPAPKQPVATPASNQTANDVRQAETNSKQATVKQPKSLVGVGSQPAYVAPPDPYVQTPLTPSSEVSYMEDRSQRQMYRVRNLATIVAVVALVVALIWAFGEGAGALGDWWNDFFGNLRL